MDSASRRAVELLETLATCKVRLVDLAQKLRRRSEVVEVLDRLECWRHPVGSLIEGYVDVELKNGHALCWYLEVRWDDEKWTIETRILGNVTESQEVLHEFPDRTAMGFDEFLKSLLDATEELVQYDALGLHER